jgi:hypothetical protein
MSSLYHCASPHRDHLKVCILGMLIEKADFTALPDPALDRSRPPKTERVMASVVKAMLGLYKVSDGTRGQRILTRYFLYPNLHPEIPGKRR